MGEAHYSRFGHGRVRHQRRLDLGGAHAVAGDVQHVVHPAGDPVVAILITTAAVAREVHAVVGREIGLNEALMIAPNRARLPRPGVQNHQVALGGSFELVALVIDQGRFNAEERRRC